MKGRESAYNNMYCISLKLDLNKIKKLNHLDIYNSMGLLSLRHTSWQSKKSLLYTPGREQLWIWYSQVTSKRFNCAVYKHKFQNHERGYSLTDSSLSINNCLEDRENTLVSNIFKYNVTHDIVTLLLVCLDRFSWDLAKFIGVILLHIYVA